MNKTTWTKLAVSAAALVAIPFLAGANGGGCGSDVVVGNNTPCVVTGCSGEICSDQAVASDCIWTDKFACYQKYGTCGRSADGTCGWQSTPELDSCLNAPDPNTCNTDADCGAPKSCLACGDGSCAASACVAGQCQVSCPPNPGQCAADSDCVMPDICQACPDGKCAQGACVNGQCGLVCNGGGPDPNACSTTSDCVFPDICKVCPDGTCAQGDCVNGACELVCNDAPTQCATDADCGSDPSDCIACDGGANTTSCAQKACINGTCELRCPSQPADCKADSDCVFPAVCVGCPDGSCAQGACVSGGCALQCAGATP